MSGTPLIGDVLEQRVEATRYSIIATSGWPPRLYMPLSTFEMWYSRSSNVTSCPLDFTSRSPRAVAHHEDAVAAAAVRGLDHEVRVTRDDRERRPRSSWFSRITP